MNKLISLVLMVTLAGCAGIGAKLCKPGGTVNEFERDKYDCEMKTRTNQPAMILIDMEQQQKCMHIEKGWSRCTN